jgi:hypothetical protein
MRPNKNQGASAVSQHSLSLPQRQWETWRAAVRRLRRKHSFGTRTSICSAQKAAFMQCKRRINGAAAGSLLC